MRCKINQPSNLGSSETIREAPQRITFYFQDYQQFGQPSHLTEIDISFLQWFIGFSEGKGSFELSKLAFVINQKDPKLLFKIKKKLGFGRIYETSVPGIWRYSVNGQKNCLRLYYLFNGNLILKKTQKRFLRWIKNLKIISFFKNPKIQITLNDGWLSGFIDAEGGFYARVRKNSQNEVGFQFLKKFYITQKNEEALLKQIGIMLESKTKIFNFLQNQKLYYRIEISAFESHTILLNYLVSYPCLGCKNINVCIWRKMHGRQDRKEHLTELGINKLRKLCYKLNKQNKKNEIEVEEIVHTAWR
jgi:hypothetical protein